MMKHWIVKKPTTANAIMAAIEAGTCTTEAHVKAIADRYGDELFWTGSLNNGAFGVSTPELLLQMGIPANLSGYRFLCDAIPLAASITEPGKVTTTIYPAVAEKWESTASRVERAIRHAVEVACDRGDYDTLDECFKGGYSAMKGKPTNSEFMFGVAAYMRRLNYGNVA